MKSKKQPGIKSILVLVVSSLLLSECVKTEDVINPESLKIWEIHNMGNGMGSDSVMSLVEDKEGNIWVGTANNGVSKFDGIKWTVYNVASGLLDNEVFCIEQDGFGNMWFGTSGGVSILSNNGWTNIPDFGPIYALMKDHDDKMWMGSSFYGVFIYDNNNLYQYYDEECELCNSVRVLFEDNEQNIWIGSWMDLKKFSGQQVISYTRNNGLPGNTITAIHQDIWGNIWIGIQFSSYVTRLNNGNLDLVDLSNGLSVNLVTSIASDNYGNVWFGLLIKGAHKYNGSMMKPYTVKDGLPDRTVMNIIKDRHGYLWFGTLSGGVVRYMPGMD